MLLEKVGAAVRSAGLSIANIDATVLAEQPMLAPSVGEMRANLARVLKITPGAISIKATRGEGLGFIGRGEGIAAMAIALLTSRT
jgi:2-C-methyl-D-erythritol 2,4-cyclodiphosphate synthase